MRRHDHRNWLSTSDLMRLMGCYAATFDFAYMNGSGPTPREASKDFTLLRKQEDPHESAKAKTLLDKLLLCARVGIFNKFQRQEAPVFMVFLTAVSAEETPCGMNFLFSLNRTKLAISHANWLALVFGASPQSQATCETVEQLRLVSPLGALPLTQMAA